MNDHLLCSDVEGTLIKTRIHLDNGKVAPSLWTAIAEELGTAALNEEERMKDRWVAGEYAHYPEFVIDTVRMHMKYDLTKSTFSHVVEQAEYYPGVEALADLIGYQKIAVSGGFTAMTERLKKELGFQAAHGACEMFWEGERLMGCKTWNTDYEQKIYFLEQYCQANNIDLAQVVFVGDGKNDAPIANYVIQNSGRAISFNGQRELAEVPGIYRIEQEEPDFTTVFELL